MAYERIRQYMRSCDNLLQLHSEGCRGDLAELLNGVTRRNVSQHELMIDDVKDGSVSDDAVHHSGTGERERTFTDNFRGAVLSNVVGHNQNSRGSGYQIHGTAHPFHQFARNGPVGKITVGSDLHGSQDGGFDVTAANHAKGRRGIKEAATGLDGDGLFARVNQIWVFFTFIWELAHTEQTVFGLQFDRNALGQVIRH